jgi:hypothetical protein
LECKEEEWDEARVGDAYATDAETGHYLLFILGIVSRQGGGLIQWFPYGVRRKGKCCLLNQTKTAFERARESYHQKIIKESPFTEASVRSRDNENRLLP